MPAATSILHKNKTLKKVSSLFFFLKQKTATHTRAHTHTQRAAVSGVIKRLVSIYSHLERLKALVEREREARKRISLTIWKRKADIKGKKIETEGNIPGWTNACDVIGWSIFHYLFSVLYFFIVCLPETLCVSFVRLRFSLKGTEASGYLWVQSETNFLLSFCFLCQKEEWNEVKEKRDSQREVGTFVCVFLFSLKTCLSIWFFFVCFFRDIIRYLWMCHCWPDWGSKVGRGLQMNI